MATYSWPELVKLWARNELDAERAIGQLLLWGRQTHDALQEQRRQQRALHDRIERCTARLDALERRHVK